MRGHRQEDIFAVGFEAMCVEGEQVVLMGLKADHLGSDVFDGEEEFSIALDERGAIEAGEFDTKTGGNIFGFSDDKGQIEAGGRE